MKTMKIWRLAFAMLAAFSLASCSSDDDNDVYEATELGGTWQKVYDEGVADADTYSAAFHYMFYLWKMGAKIVGVPSSQAPNTYMEVTQFTLPRTRLEGSISNSMQLFLSADDPCAKQLIPDILLTYDDYKRYNFDSQAEVLYLLDYIKAQ